MSGFTSILSGLVQTQESRNLAQIADRQLGFATLKQELESIRDKASSRAERHFKSIVDGLAGLSDRLDQEKSATVNTMLNAL